MILSNSSDKVPDTLKSFRQSVLAAISGELTAQWREENTADFDDWKSVKFIDVILDNQEMEVTKGWNYEISYKNLTLSATTSGYFVEGN